MPSGTPADRRINACLNSYIDFVRSEKSLSVNTQMAYQRDLVAFINWQRKRAQADFFRIRRRQPIRPAVRICNYTIGYLRQKGQKTSSIIRAIASLRGWFAWQKISGFVQVDPLGHAQSCALEEIAFGLEQGRSSQND